MPDGTEHEFTLTETGNLGPVTGAANLNSLSMGGRISEIPGGGNELNVKVSALEYVRNLSSGLETQTFAEVSSQSLTDNQTNYLYIDDSNALVVNTTGFPDITTTPNYPLGIVVTSGGVITGHTDSRPKMGLLHLPRLFSYAVASLPAAPVGFPFAYASDGVKDGETTGSGSGVLVYWDGVAWRRTADDTTVID